MVSYTGHRLNKCNYSGKRLESNDVVYKFAIFKERFSRDLATICLIHFFFKFYLIVDLDRCGFHLVFKLVI